MKKNRLREKTSAASEWKHAHHTISMLGSYVFASDVLDASLYDTDYAKKIGFTRRGLSNDNPGSIIFSQVCSKLCTKRAELDVIDGQVKDILESSQKGFVLYLG
ncbi:hypothetical protein M436DRAFT_60093 [Aureobasidium namibiae CBS 147.97]|uniref:Uncharacterized protein n=1 Tax=Aureobasidium namibiae CBS 147.97 TaxID=1043004 RepID=A0A074X823_9PEZI|nr:uncharacterized protein M436DRAFT_60093 [Aureobasidium namibiae CBS 147.97]KEQ78167.1 hypothetical protein M436DRAFT_60093 [Aureobasidium namibiae CBS 147.97]